MRIDRPFLLKSIKNRRKGLRKLKIWHEKVQGKGKVGIFATSNNIRRGGNTVNSARKLWHITSRLTME